MMNKMTLEETLDQMRRYIDRHVAGGFRDPDRIRTLALEIYSDDQPRSKLLPYADAFLREAWEAHLKEQAGWEEITDCDRLDRAFEDLEQQGIVSRQDFSCCGTCGVSEIVDEIQAERDKGRQVQGYVFFHEQDTEHAVGGQGLYLDYGSVQAEEAAYIRIGHEVEKTLRRHGLDTAWNGDLDTRIFVRMDWKRRRPAK